MGAMLARVGIGMVLWCYVALLLGRLKLELYRLNLVKKEELPNNSHEHLLVGSTILHVRAHGRNH